MGYNTDFYRLKKDGELRFLYSMSGSDCPCYYEEVKTDEEFDKTTKDIKGERAFWTNWPCVWRTSKTSDDCIIVEPLKRKWFKFWKSKNPVKIWIGVYYQKREGKLRDDDTQMWFSDIPPSKHHTENYEEPDWQLNHLKLFTLPIMK